MRNYFEPIGYRGTNPSEYHPAGKELTKEFYQRFLNERKGMGNNTVMMTAGTSGGGKTSALKKMGTNINEYPIVFDSNMKSVGSAVEKIESALQNGYKVEINYIHSNPVDAWGRVIKRAVEGEDFGGGKIIHRTVPIKAHIQNAVEPPVTIVKIAEKYKNNPNVVIKVMDNTGLAGQAKFMPIDHLRNISYNKNALERKLYERLQAENLQSSPKTQEIWAGLSGRTEQSGTRITGQKTQAGLPQEVKTLEKNSAQPLGKSGDFGFSPAEAGARARSIVEQPTVNPSGSKPGILSSTSNVGQGIPATEKISKNTGRLGQETAGLPPSPPPRLPNPI